ncbi:ESPR domain-containing protein [Buttiauxella agrestis]
MNNIYRLVWSHVANSYIAVAEISRVGKREQNGAGWKKLLAAALVLTGSYTSYAIADNVTWITAYPTYLFPENQGINYDTVR